jgi:hypothetical protein
MVYKLSLFLAFDLSILLRHAPSLPRVTLIIKKAAIFGSGFRNLKSHIPCSYRRFDPAAHVIHHQLIIVFILNLIVKVMIL